MTIAKIVLAGAAAIIIGSSALAQDALTARIVNLDEAGGKITLQRLPSGTVGAAGANHPIDEYKLQDGLAFNTFRPGDSVTFTADRIDGVWTVTTMQKQ